MIFARDLSDPLASLVKKIDAANQKNGRMGSFVVFLNDEEGFAEKVTAFAKKNGLKQCAMSIMNRAGPPRYKINAKADVTVMLYNRQRVVVNRAFSKGELNAKAVTQIVADLPKITN